MSFKRAQPLPIRGVPDIDDRILAGREQQIALGVEDDLSEGPFVTLKNDGFLVSL
jgi:hypothetical protein